jgi:hypothetical protein
MDERRIHTDFSKDSSSKIKYSKIHESIGAHHFEKYVNINLKDKYMMITKNNIIKI